MPHPIIAFIGAGTMTRCLMRGLIRKGYPVDCLVASNRSADKLAALASELGIRTAASNIAAVAAAEIVILAVKPASIEPVCRETADLTKTKKPLVISLATGIPVEKIASWLGSEEIPIVRTMSNMAAEIGKAVTALFANPLVMKEHKEITEIIFNAVGSSLWVKEQAEINALTPLVGCGPAYLFLLLEVLSKAAASLGISEETAARLTLEMVAGATLMASEAKIPAEELRRRVTTPGGATESSLKPILEANIHGLFQQALKAAKERCEEIEIRGVVAPAAKAAGGAGSC